MLVDAKGADWPLTRKFGCDAEMGLELLSAIIDALLEKRTIFGNSLSATVDQN